MYAIRSYYDLSSLRVYDLRDETKPVFVREETIGFGIETIFAKDNYLFLGSRTGVYIYSISDPSHPQQLSIFQHLYSCDPVVVSGHYAYSTLNFV